MTNYGHFTTMRVEGLRVRGLSLHLQRLRRDCRAVFGKELDTEQVRTRVREHLARTSEPAVTVRVTVTAPELRLERPAADAALQILVTSRPVASEPPPLRVRTVRHTREVPVVKHTGLFGALHQRRAAQTAGYDDALFVDDRSALVEGPTWNIGFLDDARLLWPAAEALPGVTQELLRRHHAGAQCTEDVQLADLPRFRAAFATNAGFGVRPIVSINDVTYDVDDDILHTLRKEYEAVRLEPL